MGSFQQRNCTMNCTLETTSEGCESVDITSRKVERNTPTGRVIALIPDSGVSGAEWSLRQERRALLLGSVAVLGGEVIHPNTKASKLAISRISRAQRRMALLAA